MARNHNDATEQMLREKFTANGWQPMSVRTPTRDVIKITPCAYGPDDVADEKSVGHYLLDCDCDVMLWGASSLRELAGIVDGFAAVKAEDADQKRKLKEFYVKHIQHVGMPWWNLSFRLMQDWIGITIDEGIQDRTEICRLIAESRGLEEQTVKYCMDIQDDWSTYSDWHKDVYGRRPRLDRAPAAATA